MTAISKGDDIRPCFVYVLGDGVGPHKIGISISPEDRCKAVANETARPLRVEFCLVLPSIKEAIAVERMAHHLLGQCRLPGEMFDVACAEAVSAVNDARLRCNNGERAPQISKDGSRLSFPASDQLLRAVDNYRAGQGRILTRSEAVRRLIEGALDSWESDPAAREAFRRKRAEARGGP